MQSDGYTLDDKRNKLEGYGDLQDIVTQYQARDASKDRDRKAKHFFVPKVQIVAENYDLSMSKYKEDTFEEVAYEKPAVILKKLKTMEKEIDTGLSELEGILK
jgi:type I restriction enzyme M protein